MKSKMRLKFYILIIPFTMLVVLFSGTISYYESRKAITRVVNRHLAYKAEQLRDFLFSQWQVMENLDIEESEEYRDAARSSFSSYAYSLLRDETETIIVVDSKGNVVDILGMKSVLDIAPSEEGDSPRINIPVGWFTSDLFGEAYIGVGFRFEPFEWTVAVTELRSQYFSEVKYIREVHFYLLAAAAIVITVFITLYANHILGPMERLASTIEEITDTGNIGLRAEVEYADEIGLLAMQFNSMIKTLQFNYSRLEIANKSEKASRDTAIQRETETLYLLGRISDFRDETTGDHLYRIGSLSSLFARLLGESREFEDLISKSSPLHDIGKVAIPDAILLKPASLNSKEYEVIKTHTLLGHELLKDSESIYLKEGAEIALTHHEHWDGNGYPRGLKGTEIPLAGRIVGLLDVFDALISNRPYKEAWSCRKALEYIVTKRGTQFDPVLTDLFEKHFKEFCTSAQM